MTSEAPALPKYNGRFLRVRNLDKYQHYKARNPPWIKLHQLILEDYDFGQLPDASKWHAIGIALLASRMDNRIPADPKWISARIGARSRVDLRTLVSVSFLEPCASCGQDASKALAECKQNADSEGEGEREQRESNSIVAPVPGATANGLLRRQVQAVYEIHCAARVKFYEKVNGQPPGVLPDLSAPIKKVIRNAIQQHGFAKAWQAGIGIFYSDWHTGRDPETKGKRYLGLPLVWSINPSRDNVETFAELYHEIPLGDSMQSIVGDVMEAHDVSS